MPQENYQKIKLLKLVELLRQETDEEHPMRTGVICDKLRAMNITCDRRTLHRDMKMLNEHGYEVMKELIDHEMAYYISDRSFREALIKSARADSEGFWLRTKGEKCGNTVCISHFSP